MSGKPYISNAATLIRARVMDLIWHGSETESGFAATVREHYEASVEPGQRTIEWSFAKDPADRMKADADKVFGMLKNTIRRRLPVELLESVIAAMPAGARFSLQVELCGRQGLMAVPKPQHGGGADALLLGRISKEISDVFADMGHLLSDNELNAKDAEKAPHALQSIDEAVAVLLEQRAAIVEKALGGVDNVVQLGASQ